MIFLYFDQSQACHNDMEILTLKRVGGWLEKSNSIRITIRLEVEVELQICKPNKPYNFLKVTKYDASESTNLMSDLKWTQVTTIQTKLKCSKIGK